MKTLRNILIFFPVIIFFMIIVAASGGGSSSSAEPISIVASKQKVEQYADYASSLGVPWDIILLSDVLNADKSRQKGVEQINPTYTTLDFLRAVVEVEHYEVVGKEIHTDPDTGDEYEVDVYDWVYNRTDEHVAKSEILGYIGISESENPSITPQEILNRLSQKATEDSNEEWRYRAYFVANTDYKEVLKNYLQIEPDKIDKIIKLHDTEYMNRWLSEESKARINAMLMENGLDQTNTVSGNRSYDGVSFTDGETPVMYYNQGDPRWGDQLYVTKSIRATGCGPTSLSIVVSSLTGVPHDPPTICAWAKNGNYYLHGQGSLHSVIPDGARHYGLQVSGCSKNEPQRIIDALSSGKLVVAIMSKGHFTSGGHFIVLRGVTEDGKILVADPGSIDRSGKKWDFSLIISEAKTGASAGGPFWIISK